MLYLIAWLCFAVACFKIAENKNRDKFAWGVLGFIFGIFALLVLLILPPLEKFHDKK